MIPNLITAFRLALGVPIVALAAGNGSPAAFRLALGLLILAGASDFLDGWAARRLGQVTAVGTFFDPLVDKILANVLLVFLAFEASTWVDPGLVILILAREFAVQGFRSMAPLKGVVIQTRRISKAKFFFQWVCVACTLAGLGFEQAAWLRSAARVSLVLALTAAYVSMVRIFWANRDLFARPSLPMEKR